MHRRRLESVKISAGDPKLLNLADAAKAALTRFRSAVEVGGCTPDEEKALRAAAAAAGSALQRVIEHSRKKSGGRVYYGPSARELFVRAIKERQKPQNANETKAPVQCDCGSGSCPVFDNSGKCNYCDQFRDDLIHLHGGNEPFIMRGRERLSVFELLPVSARSPRSRRYSWIHEAPWLFQLGSICVDCVRVGYRIERCFETGGGWGFHDYRHKDGTRSTSICVDCGDVA